MTDDALIAPDDSAWGLRILRLAKREALARLTERTAHHAAALGRPMPSVAIADPKARWGSCRPGPARPPGGDPLQLAAGAGPVRRGRLRGRPRMRPPDRGQSRPALLGAVRETVGDPAPHRRWLRAHAAELHAISA
jgi:hypothetical protein